VASGFGDRICVFAAIEDDATDKEKQLSPQTVQQQQQQQHQQHLLLRRFAAKVAVSHRFLRFLVFKTQVSICDAADSCSVIETLCCRITRTS
jgi:hypothetical protein